MLHVGLKNMQFFSGFRVRFFVMLEKLFRYLCCVGVEKQ